MAVSGKGGGLHISNPNLTDAAILTGCQFLENIAEGSAPNGGAIFINDAVLHIDDSQFIGNIANGRGGAIQLSGQDSQLSMINCSFADNQAGDKGDGIFKSRTSSVLELETCSFAECCQVVPPNSFIDYGENDYESWCDDCRSDVNCDNLVDAADLGLLLSAWNTSEAQYDLDGDGTVAGGDIGYLLGSWSVCAP